MSEITETTSFQETCLGSYDLNDTQLLPHLSTGCTCCSWRLLINRFVFCLFPIILSLHITALHLTDNLIMQPSSQDIIQVAGIGRLVLLMGYTWKRFSTKG